LCFHKDL